MQPDAGVPQFLYHAAVGVVGEIRRRAFGDAGAYGGYGGQRLFVGGHERVYRGECSREQFGYFRAHVPYAERRQQAREGALLARLNRAQQVGHALLAHPIRVAEVVFADMP